MLDPDRPCRRRGRFASYLVLYDCFTFFNELDILELRLNILRDVVDRFVLVEASETHQGEVKPLHFGENRARFDDFATRISHVVVHRFPPGANTPWARENYQRDRIAAGLTGVRDGDLVLVSDVDEIPDPKAILASTHSSYITVFRQLLSYYFLNCIAVRPKGTIGTMWSGTVMFRYQGYMERPQRYRELVGLRGWPGDTFINRLRAVARAARRRHELEGRVRFVENAGWHFSYTGGIENIVTKLQAFAHSEYNTPHFTEPGRIMAAIQRGEDLFERDLSFQVIELDQRFPRWLRENAHTYEHLIVR